MKQRITLTIDKKLLEELRVIQSDKMLQQKQSVSLSSVINTTLKEGMKRNKVYSYE